ncbi:MAG: hypothetical protein AAFX52_08715 [Pseudomonadota bacterium]
METILAAIKFGWTSGPFILIASATMGAAHALNEWRLRWTASLFLFGYMFSVGVRKILVPADVTMATVHLYHVPLWTDHLRHLVAIPLFIYMLTRRPEEKRGPQFVQPQWWLMLPLVAELSLTPMYASQASQYLRMLWGGSAPAYFQHHDISAGMVFAFQLGAFWVYVVLAFWHRALAVLREKRTLN